MVDVFKLTSYSGFNGTSEQDLIMSSSINGAAFEDAMQEHKKSRVMQFLQVKSSPDRSVSTL